MKYLELFPDGFDSSLTEKVKAENWPFVGHDVITGEVVYSDLLVEPQQLYYIYYTTADNTPINIPTKEYYEGEYPEVPAVVDQIVYNTYENGLGVIALNSPVLVKNMGTDSYIGFGNTSIFLGSNITSITFPSVASEDDKVRHGAFMDCDYLHTVNLPVNTTTIDAYAFDRCHALETFEVPSGCILIGDEWIVGDAGGPIFSFVGSFLDCTSLSHITIPNSVKLIGAGCFSNCPLLTEIDFNGTQDEWDSIEKTFTYYHSDYEEYFTINWNDESSITTVHCTDGDITL